MSTTASPQSGLEIVKKGLSDKAINNARWTESLSHNLTKFPLVAGAVAGLGCVLFGPAVPLLVLAIGGGVFGLGSFGYNLLFRGHDISMEHVHRVQKEILEHHERRKDVIAPQLREFLGNSDVALLVQQALGQFANIDRSYRGFLDVLERKLSSGELTFVIMSTPAAAVAASVYDNLNHVVTILTSISSIDAGELRQRIARLSRNTSRLEDLGKKKLEALSARLRVYEEGIGQIERLLVENEEAVTSIETSSQKIAEMQTGLRFSETDMQTAMGELQRVAERSSTLFSATAKS